MSTWLSIFHVQLPFYALSRGGATPELHVRKCRPDTLTAKLSRQPNVRRRVVKNTVSPSSFHLVVDSSTLVPSVALPSEGSAHQDSVADAQIAYPSNPA
ncbi:hypothetical protein C8T65DRAFT_746413 [Cerioporus squamosus]|nr:hypothetical protein C8T65DRAFT_746413 [Cerioporus squamosus]